jgi:hypothetical protein
MLLAAAVCTSFPPVHRQPACDYHVISANLSNGQQIVLYKCNNIIIYHNNDDDHSNIGKRVY